MPITPDKTPGTVYLVGAGPGDPGLLPMRAVECLGRADLVLYDYLASPAALEHVSPSAELVCLGNHRSGRSLSQDEIVVRMLAGAREGKTVVRLKGGDPSIFGRGVDEIIPLREAEIPFEIVPGITAGLAAAAYAEIPVTHHLDASAVALITGQERHAKSESSLDYDALARFPGTLIFYMGVRRSAVWSRALIEKGKPPETPVAIVRWCTRPRSSRRSAARWRRLPIRSPRKRFCHRLYSWWGNVVGGAPDLCWCGSPTRCLGRSKTWWPRSPSHLQGPRRGGWAELGAEVIAQPAIRLTDPPDWSPVDAALDTLDQYDWLVFSSKNGVDHFFRRLFDRRRRRAPAGLRQAGRG